jgi:hypothetical protein
VKPAAQIVYGSKALLQDTVNGETGGGSSAIRITTGILLHLPNGWYHGLLLHIHRAMHAVIDPQKIHGIHFRVLAKCLRMSGGDHLHSGTVVGKLEGDRAITLGFVDLMRSAIIPRSGKG